MHFICSTFGSAGDVFPLLGLALELRSRGHEITFITNGHFESLVAEHGLRFEALGTAEEFDACIRNPNLWHPRQAFRYVIQSLQPALRTQFELHAAHAGERDVVAITNCFGMGALMAQDKYGIPALTVHLQPAVLWSDHAQPQLPGLFGPAWLRGLLYRFGSRWFVDPVICPYLNEWRRELGLKPIRGLMKWWNSPYGVLAMFPDWYAPVQPDWPQPLLQTSFPLWNHGSDAPLPRDVEEFLEAGSPPLVFTPGSANIHGEKFFAAAVDACRRLDRRGVLLTKYAEQIPQNLPDTVRHVKYVPLDRLLSQVAAFVHHGGVGSMSQAMLAGIPQLIMPLAHDQFDNAHRVRNLNLGSSLPVSRFTGPRLANALQPLIESPEVCQACQEVARRLAPRDGLRLSADAIEKHCRSNNGSLLQAGAVG